MIDQNGREEGGKRKERWQISASRQLTARMVGRGTEMGNSEGAGYREVCVCAALDVMS